MQNKTVAIPNKGDIKKQLNPFYNKYFKIFDTAFNKDLQQSNNSLFIKEWYIPFQMNEYENFNFSNQFKEIIQFKIDHIDEMMQDLLNKKQINTDYKGNLYLLIGKIGTGKTTFLTKYMSQNDINVCNIDLSILATDIHPEEKRIREFIHNEIKKYFRNNFNNYFHDPDSARDVFGTNILKGISIDELSKLITEKTDDYINYLINYLFTNKKIKIMFILDNGDTCDKKVIDVIKSVLREIMREYPAMFILVMRDYVYKHNIFGNDFQHIFPMIQIPKNNLKEIIKRRIKWSIEEIGKYSDVSESDLDILQETSRGDEIINNIRHKIIPDTAKKILEKCIDHFEKSDGEHSIFGNIQKITDENIREALELIYAFFHSSMLDLGPLFSNIRAQEENNNYQKYRNIDFRDFIDCCIAMHKRCFDKESPIINIFNLDNSLFVDDYINTLGIYIVLRIIKNSKIEKELLWLYLEQLKMTDGRKKGIINYMLSKNLIKSTNHEMPEINYVSELKITSKGLMYLDYLPLRFSYLYYVSDDTPIDKKYCVSYEEREKSFENRKRAVLNFLDFLCDEEKRLQKILEDNINLKNKIYYNNEDSLFQEARYSISSEIEKIRHAIKCKYTESIR